jgi:predicted GNAT family acetyltransferase
MMEQLKNYQNATDFLQRTQADLMRDETLNNLMLGNCLRMIAFPERLKAQPYFATVEDTHGLIIAAMMIPPNRLMLYYDDTRNEWGAALEKLAQNLLENNLTVPGVIAPNTIADAFVPIWSQLSGKTYQLSANERVYKLTQVIPPTPTDGQMRLATLAEVELLADWWTAFVREALPLQEPNLEQNLEIVKNGVNDGNLYVWEVAGQAVTMVNKSRNMPHGRCIGPVYTPPEFRGHGYASNCVASVSQLILDSGKDFCGLFTDLANPTSNSIYQKIGYQPLADFNEYS